MNLATIELVTALAVKFLQPELLDAAWQLDQQCLGGLWTPAGYQREMASPNSDLIALTCSLLPPNEQSAEGAGHTQGRECLIGLACLWSILDEAHITLLAVDPDYRHQGLGQMLLWTLLLLAQDRGLQWATLEVRPSNQAAISLYSKFGFKEVGRRRGYYTDPDEDGLILWRHHLHHPDFGQTLAQWYREIQANLPQSARSLQICLPAARAFLKANLL